MVKAYVLVQTSVGRAVEVSQALRALPEVKQSDDVTGPYDVIVTVECPDVDQLGHVVTANIQKVEGIMRTVTCPVVHLA